MAQTPHEVAYEVALRRLDVQLQQVDIVDSKVGIGLGLTGTALGIFAGFFAVVVDPDEPASVAFAAASGAIVMGVFLVSVWNGFVAWAIGEWDQRPNWDDLLANIQELSHQEMQLWITEGCILSLKQNEPKLRRKTIAAANVAKFALIDVVLIALSLSGLSVVNAITG